MKISKILVACALLHGLLLNTELQAGEAPATAPYSGDVWNRSTLTADWGGLRNEWAAKGLTLDANITQVGQGVVESLHQVA